MPIWYSVIVTRLGYCHLSCKRWIQSLLTGLLGYEGYSPTATRETLQFWTWGIIPIEDLKWGVLIALDHE